jgi:hypothetical protein
VVESSLRGSSVDEPAADGRDEADEADRSDSSGSASGRVDGSAKDDVESGGST